MPLIIIYPKRPKGPSITCYADVKRIASRMGLTNSTMAMITDRGFGSVQGLRAMKESDIEGLPLYTGQQLAIIKLITHLNEVLAGYEIKDALIEKKEEEVINVQSNKENGQEEEKEGTKKDLSNAGILNNDGYPEGQAVGPRIVPRPHEFLVGKTCGRDLTMEEFLYGNLLIMEYMMEQNSLEVRAYIKHLRFMVLKLVHGYRLEQVVFYDYALRTKIEHEQVVMPLTADQALLDKYVNMNKDSQKKKKKKDSTKSGKRSKGGTGKAKKKSKKADEDNVIGL